MRRTSLTIAFLMLFASPSAAQDGVQVGVSAAVHGDVQLARGAVVGRQVDSGEAIFLDDVISAGAESGMQILLLDQTVFTIGAGSEIVIDTFVFDPQTGVGDVAVSVTKGVFRFVTGQVAQQDPDRMSVNTPLGTIGIRGTIAGGSVQPGRVDVVLLGPGINTNTQETPGGITVSNDLGSVDIDRSGYGTTLIDGAAPSVPVPVDISVLGGLGAGGVEEGSDDGSSGANDGEDAREPAAESDGSVLTNANAESGQASAVSFESASRVGGDVGGVLDQSNDTASVVQEASAAIGDISTIAQLDGLSGQFFFSDTFSLSDGGSYIVGIDIDFDNRTVGGGNSGFSLNPVSFTGADFAFLSNGFDTGAGGTALFDGQTNINFACGGDACVADVRVAFKNVGELAAGAMEHDVTVVNTTQSITVTGGGTDTGREAGQFDGF